MRFGGSIGVNAINRASAAPSPAPGQPPLRTGLLGGALPQQPSAQARSPLIPLCFPIAGLRVWLGFLGRHRSGWAVRIRVILFSELGLVRVWSGSEKV